VLVASCAVAASCAALSACGGAGHGDAAASSGRALFTQACGACHTLTGHNDPRHQGGDLRGFHASRTQLDQLASEMPVRRPLSREQLQAVVGFVMGAEASR
jgi:mono/diheme cytochrome c family protein